MHPMEYFKFFLTSIMYTPSDEQGPETERLQHRASEGFRKASTFKADTKKGWTTDGVDPTILEVY